MAMSPGSITTTRIVAPDFNGWSALTFSGEEVVCRILGNGITTQYGYQASRRVSGLWDHRGGYDPTNSTWPASNISSRFYGYAPDGQLTWTERAADGGASGSALEDGTGESYAYNADNSLSAFGFMDANTYQTPNSQGDSVVSAGSLPATTGVTAPNSYANNYTYDASGNRTEATQMGTAIGYSATTANRYNYMLYDGNGDTTDATAGWTYAYDAEGRMNSATRLSDNYTIDFGYDVANRLIYQSCGTVPTIFCYAGKQRIEERALSNNASIYRYFYNSPTSGQIVFRQSTTASMFYQYDALGNTTHVSDANGNILEQYLYDAYGTPYVYNKAGVYQGEVSAQDNRYLFHGASAYEWLSTPGLYYCRHRMYLPVLGRWLTPDPASFSAGDVNLYRYCGNDPVNCSDPTGLIGGDLEDGDEVLPAESAGAPGEDDDDDDDDDDDYDYDDDDDDRITTIGTAPTGSHIPVVSYTATNSDGAALLFSSPVSGISTLAQSSPLVTAIGGLSFTSPQYYPADQNNAVGIYGVGQDGDAAQELADEQHMDVGYNTNSNPLVDVLVSIIQKVDGGVNVANGYDLANFIASNFSDSPALYPYSQGSLDTVEAISNYGTQASSITWYAPAVSQLGTALATAEAGASYGGYYQNPIDISNIYAPSSSLSGFLSGFLFPLNPSSHTSYPIYVKKPGP